MHALQEGGDAEATMAQPFFWEAHHWQAVFSFLVRFFFDFFGEAESDGAVLARFRDA